MAKNLMSVFGPQSGKPATSEAPATTAQGDGGTMQDPQSTPNRLPVMVLGKTLTFKGELWADEDLMLFGRVEGFIRHTSSLTVGLGGTVIGDIHAKVIIVKGTVDGDLEATESITIAPTGNVLGDVSAPRVCIVEGAQFNGAVEMTQAPATEVEGSAPTTTPKTTKPNEVLTDKAVEDVLSGK